MGSNPRWNGVDLDLRNIDFVDLSATDDGFSQHSKASRPEGRKTSSAMLNKGPANQQLPDVTNTIGNGLLSPVSSAPRHRNLPTEVAPPNPQPRSYIYDLADVAFVNEYTRLEQIRLAKEFEERAAGNLSVQLGKEVLQKSFGQPREEAIHMLRAQLPGPGKATNALQRLPQPFREGATDELLYQSEGHDAFSDSLCPASTVSVKRAEQSSISYSPKSSSRVDDVTATMMDLPLASSYVSSPQNVHSLTSKSPNSSMSVGHSNDDTSETAQNNKPDDDPDWVSGAEFDPEFVDLFRGIVKFV
ncbi:hypothetical protein B0H67DRAFT_588970 [Lasiosphaeris hirsuta]|uniref:Uncharacterized protein n=1 Tax=Lasiosphaeris hirsuta TaxID=260670 RepID=A0AA40A2B7_9PEZI|nr:hypothetical protein B0H67DRAFT_588970 [Lasiosphaeris hirsuta]